MTLVELATLTSAEAGRLGEDSVGLIHLGSLEQHGPHLPLITDAVLGERLAHAVAVRLDAPIVVTPVIPVGVSDHHLGFPGTATVAPETLRAVVEAFLGALASTGVRRTAVFSAHGGNFPLLEELQENGERAGMELACFTDFDRFVEVMMTAGREAGVEPPVTDVHAGVLETSAMLAVMPGHVGAYRDVTGYLAAEDGWLDRLGRDGTASLHRTGVLGDPRQASAETGAAVMRALADLLADWVAERFELRRLPA